MSENKLPSGVGKKIVEALKKQTEIEIPTIVNNRNMTVPNSVQSSDSIVDADNITVNLDENTGIEESQQFNLPNNDADMKFQQHVANIKQSQVSYEQDIPQIMAQNDYFQQASSQPNYYQQPMNNFNYNQNYVENSYVQPQNAFKEKDFTTPANVAVLKRLIMQLPQGVAKQTGAQIIRQTMEALGISMSTVLSEAQGFQDELNNSIRECVSSIQEYKNNIKNLEKQVNDYQKQSAQMNDLISLFIMTDK